MKPQKVNAMDVLRLIPDEELARLAAGTKVDYCAKVLTGERMFYLLVYAFLAADEVGQRRLEWVFNSSMFKSLFNLAEGASVTHGSISTRLKKIDVGFFEKAFELLYARLSSMYSAKEMERYNIVRVDSTMVAETCNKLMAGFNVGKKPGGGRPARRQIKYTVAYDGFAAKLAEVFSEARLPKFLNCIFIHPKYFHTFCLCLLSLLFLIFYRYLFFPPLLHFLRTALCRLCIYGLFFSKI